MPLTAAEKTQLQASVQTIADDVAALVVDPIPHPLQVLLDQANADKAALQAKINAAKVAAQAEAAADAAEDNARANVLAALG